VKRTGGFHVAVLGNTEITKLRTERRIVTDCLVLLVGLQSRSLLRCVLVMLPCEKEALQAAVGLLSVGGIALHVREVAEDDPVRVANQCQSVRVAVAAAVKFGPTKE
jgi:hypothetical protein